MATWLGFPSTHSSIPTSTPIHTLSDIHHAMSSSSHPVQLSTICWRCMSQLPRRAPSILPAQKANAASLTLQGSRVQPAKGEKQRHVWEEGVGWPPGWCVRSLCRLDSQLKACPCRPVEIKTLHSTSTLGSITFWNDTTVATASLPQTPSRPSRTQLDQCTPARSNVLATVHGCKGTSWGAGTLKSAACKHFTASGASGGR